MDAVRGAGAVAAGCAVAAPVDPSVRNGFLRWLSDGAHASMAYMERNVALRLDPRLLLPGARTVISIAFPYAPPPSLRHSAIADFALGEDYHRALRRRLLPVVELISRSFGAFSRICVDSAPVLERYWAAKAGVGFIGLNRQLIVPGVGSGVFLAEIITSLELSPDSPLASSACTACRRCLDACPGRALSADGLDARRCRSYLSIEHRGDLPPEIDFAATVYGCDICRRVCPLDASAPTPLPEFLPSQEILSLDRNALSSISSGRWKKIVKLSAMSRISAAQMRRNCKG